MEHLVPLTLTPTLRWNTLCESCSSNARQLRAEPHVNIYYLLQQEQLLTLLHRFMLTLLHRVDPALSLYVVRAGIDLIVLGGNDACSVRRE